MKIPVMALALALGCSPALFASSSGLPDVKQASPGLIDLGKQLFFDRRLSVNGTLSCGMCHIPEQGFTQNQLTTPVGIEGRKVKRNSPTLLNVAFRNPLFFDGREFTLENQIWSPLLHPREMGNLSVGSVLKRIAGMDPYLSRFEALFPEGLTIQTLGQAIAAYEKTLVAGNSPFDRWYFGGDSSALTPDARNGYRLFVQHGCPQCHTIGSGEAQFTDDDFHNTGIGYERSMVTRRSSALFETESLNDLGRYELTGDPADKWKYRTPTLRNIALTAPYMHDGSFPSLESVVRFYMRGGISHEGLDERIRPFSLTEREIAQLVIFLESLTSPAVESLVRDARKAPVGDY